jgi:hypothetical protein
VFFLEEVPLASTRYNSDERVAEWILKSLYIMHHRSMLSRGEGRCRQQVELLTVYPQSRQHHQSCRLGACQRHSRQVFLMALQAQVLLEQGVPQVQQLVCWPRRSWDVAW